MKVSAYNVFFHANHLQHLHFLALSSSSITAQREGKHSVTQLTLLVLRNGVSLGLGEAHRNFFMWFYLL